MVRRKKSEWKAKPIIILDERVRAPEECVEFRTPEGRTLCRIKALPDGRFEFRSLADQLLISPVVSNVIYITVLD